VLLDVHGIFGVYVQGKGDEIMPFCGKCGTSVNEGTTFCSKCGAPIASVSGSAPTSGAQQGLAPNVAGLLCYFLIPGIIFLGLEPYKNDKFIRFHAFQSIFLFVFLIAFGIVWNGILGMLFVGVSFLWPIISLIATLVWLASFLIWLFLMFKAYSNEKFMLPFIGELAAKQAGS
jgi:uncharacterized membrane protein